MKQCIDDCQYGHDVCVETIVHCLTQGGEHAAVAHIGLLLDCAEICQTSANLMVRNSHLHGELCAVCALACEQCAESCERFGQDERMKRCAEVCRKCAASCRTMAGQHRVAA
jgi:hypothetical protein